MHEIVVIMAGVPKTKCGEYVTYDEVSSTQKDVTCKNCINKERKVA